MPATNLLSFRMSDHSNWFRPYVLVIFLMGVMQGQLLGQGQPQFFDNWRVKDGLPQTTVNSVVQSPDGYIWLATEGGLVRFDGVEFISYTIENTPGIESNRIRSLHARSNGDLIIGTYKGGLTVLTNGSFEKLNKFYGWEKLSIREIVEDNLGRLWISNSENDSLLVLDAATFERIDIVQSVSKQTGITIFNIDNLYYLPTSDGIAIRDEGINLIPGMEDIKPQKRIDAVVPQKNSENFWVVDQGHLTKYRKDSIIETFRIPHRDQYSPFVTLFQSTKDKLYIGFYGNSTMVVFDIRNVTFSTFEIDEVCPNGAINHVFEDAENNIWMASDICGLIKLKPNRFSYLGPEIKSLDQNIYPIIRDSLGRFLVGTREDDLIIFDEDAQTISKPDYLLIEGSFVTSIETYKGAVYYAAVARNYILKWRGKDVEKIYFPNGRRQQTNAIYASKNAELLVGTEEGIYLLKDNKLIDHPLSGKIETPNVVSFHEDDKNQLWIVSEQIVLCYDQINDSIVYKSHFDRDNRRFFRGIYGDPEGNIYVGSYGFGLHVITGDTMFNLTKAHGLAENVVSTITEDQSGNLWFTGNTGLTRVSKSELFEVIQDGRKKFNSVLYNEETDGLRTGEFNGGIQQAKCWLGGQRYAFPSLRGAVIVDFSDMGFNKLKPPVHIQRLTYADTILSADKHIDLPYTDSRLEIYFTALSYVSPQNVRFKYKLDGFETFWTDAGTERKTSYSKLPPGEYTFRVMACNNEGIWNEEGASLGITIAPPFYMTWWFRMGSILLMLLVTILIVWQIVAQNRKRERQKSALMDLLPDLVFKIDRHGNYLDIYGKPSDFPEPLENFNQKKFSDFLPEKISEDAILKISQAIETGEMQEYPYKVRQANGSERYFESRFIAIDRNEVLCIIRDITRQRLSAKRIRESERKLLNAVETEKKLLKRITEQQKLQLEAIVNTEENERKRIAKDLHDGIGQLLSSIKINLGVARSRLDREDYHATATMVDKSKLAIDQITSELRNISYNLLPPSLEQFGLATAIEEEVNRLKSKPDLFIHFDNSTKRANFDKKIEIVLFRVFQEMLNNALKHSDATEITIQLIEHKNSLMLMLEDDGRGFDIEAGILKKNSSGLKNLYSRIELVKGTIHIDSAASSGTTITIEIPL